MPKTFSYVGKDDDGGDVILQLEWIEKQPEYQKEKAGFMLQEVVDGTEAAISGWWMGKDWKRDDDGRVLCEFNCEFKKAENGDRGLTTGETGTVMKLTNKDIKLFEETVEKFTPILKEECPDVIVNFDCNVGIAEEEGKAVPYLFETTPREPYPESCLQQFLLDTPTSEFFSDLIDGKQGNIKWKDNWGMVTVLGAGSFPQETDTHDGSFKDQPVKFPFTDWDEHVAPFYIKYDTKKEIYRIADYYEYVCGVTYNGDDLKEVNNQCVKMMDSIVVRAPHLRTDIADIFLKDRLPILKKYGYIA
jgi:phosphoribosylamine-glycine ligase